MGETKEQIIEEIGRTRGVLDKDLNALEARFKARFKEETNVRVQAERHPWALVGMVIGAGLFLGIIFAALSGE